MITVGYNFGRKVHCPLCKSDIGDTQEHMLNCVIMKIACQQLYNINDEKPEDIYSLKLQKLINISKICESIARKREEILS